MGKSAKASQEVSEYRLSMHMGVCLKAVDKIHKIIIGERVAWEGEVTSNEIISVNNTGLFGGPKKEGGVAGSVYALFGKDNQIMPNELARRLGHTNLDCPAFRGLTTLFFVGDSTSIGLDGESQQIEGAGFYWTANSPFIQNVAADCQRSPVGLNPAYAQVDDYGNVNGVHIVYECLTDTDFGMGAPAWQFETAAWEAAGETLHTENFGLSLLWTRQTEIESFVGEILDHIQATVYTNPRSGKLGIKLLRNDYDFDSLRQLDFDNSKVTTFQRKLWGETVNEIVVTYTNPENEQEETVAQQDIANVAAQGAPVSDARNYYAVRSAELATRLAARDLRISSAPLAVLEVMVNRREFDILPGEVLRCTYPRYKLFDVVMRVIGIDYGKKGEPDIKLNLIEDVFSLSRMPTNGSGGTAFNGAAEAPQPMAHTTVFTLPAFLAARELADQARNLAYPEVISGVLASPQGNDTISFELYAEGMLANGQVVWESSGTKSVSGRASTLTPLYPEAVTTMFGMPLVGQGRGPQVGGFAIFGSGADTESEIALIRSIDSATGEWTLDRGVLDTVPRPWPVETPVWFLSASALISDDDKVRSVGETPDYKLATRTSLGVLTLGLAPTVSGTMTARPHMPLRPANVKVNGTAFAEHDATDATELVCTWANRNRTFEDGIVVPWTDPNVSPEQGQETLLTVYRQNGAVMFTVRGLWTETSYSIPIAWVQQELRVFIRFSSERAGLGSLQNHGIWVKHIPQIATPAAPPPSPVIVGDMPDPPEPEPDPTPEPLPPPDAPPPVVPGGGGGTGEWLVNQD